MPLGSVSAGMFAQVPAPFWLQAMQVGHDAAPQHAPSTQLALAHWFAAAQLPPSAFLATQLPEAQ